MNAVKTATRTRTGSLAAARTRRQQVRAGASGRTGVEAIAGEAIFARSGHSSPEASAQKDHISGAAFKGVRMIGTERHRHRSSSSRSRPKDVDLPALPEDPDPFAFDAIEARLALLKRKKRRARRQVEKQIGRPSDSAAAGMNGAESAYGETDAIMHLPPVHLVGKLSPGSSASPNRVTSMHAMLRAEREAARGINPLAQNPRLTIRRTREGPLGVRVESKSRSPSRQREREMRDMSPMRPKTNHAPDKSRRGSQKWAKQYPALYRASLALRGQGSSTRNSALTRKQLLCAANDVSEFIRIRSRE